MMDHKATIRWQRRDGFSAGQHLEAAVVTLDGGMLRYYANTTNLVAGLSGGGGSLVQNNASAFSQLILGGAGSYLSPGR